MMTPTTQLPIKSPHAPAVFDGYLNVGDLCRAYGIQRSTFQRWTKHGTFPRHRALRLYQAVLYPKDSVDEWIRGNLSLHHTTTKPVRKILLNLTR